jgi:hypothetical protein
VIGDGVVELELVFVEVVEPVVLSVVVDVTAVVVFSSIVVELVLVVIEKTPCSFSFKNGFFIPSLLQ